MSACLFIESRDFALFLTHSGATATNRASRCMCLYSPVLLSPIRASWSHAPRSRSHRSMRPRLCPIDVHVPRCRWQLGDHPVELLRHVHLTAETRAGISADLIQPQFCLSSRLASSSRFSCHPFPGSSRSILSRPKHIALILIPRSAAKKPAIRASLICRRIAIPTHVSSRPKARSNMSFSSSSGSGSTS